MLSGPKKSFRTLFDRAGLVVIAVIFLLAVSINSRLPGHLRWDLTENQLYTLSEGSKEILRDIPEPLELNLVFSAQAASGAPGLRSYAARVGDLLEEFQRHSSTKLTVSIIDPVPFSDEEDLASLWGLQAVTLNNSDPVFFGIAGTNSVDGLETIPFLDPGREEFLEYDLASLIFRLSRPNKPVLSVLSSLPGFNSFSNGQATGFQTLSARISEQYEMISLEADAGSVPQSTDILLLIQPPALSGATTQAIEEYVLNGGRTVIFSDSFSEALPSALPVELPFLKKLGISFTPGQFVASSRYALRIASADNGRPISHPALLGLNNDALNKNDVVTAKLDNINVGISSAVLAENDSDVLLQPLISVQDATLIPVEAMFSSPDPEQLYRLMNEPAAPANIAVRVSHADQPNGLNLILIGDTDLLSDRYWVQLDTLYGQTISTAFAANGDFMLNLLDNLSGSEALIGSRSRSTFSRPFTRVTELRAAAEESFRVKEQRLQEELAATESRLNELQLNDNGQMADILQTEELDRFVEERLRIRQELRNVRRNLDEDIRALGTRLEIINIAAVPLAITFIWIVILLVRKRQS